YAHAAAGGATAMGDQHEVELVRNGARLNRRINTDARIAETPLRSGDQIFVPERSFGVRNSGLVATAISVSASLAIALFIRHLSHDRHRSSSGLPGPGTHLPGYLASPGQKPRVDHRLHRT